MVYRYKTGHNKSNTDKRNLRFGSVYLITITEFKKHITGCNKSFFKISQENLVRELSTRRQIGPEQHKVVVENSFA